MTSRATAFQVEVVKAAARDAALMQPMLLLLVQLAATQPQSDALPAHALHAMCKEVRPDET